MSALGKLIHGIQYAAGVADKPARVVRNTLGGQNPLTGLTDFSNSEVVDNPAAPSGRDLLEQYGVLGANTPGLDVGDVGGVVGEIATDPLSYLGGLGIAAKGLGAVGKGAGMLGRGVRGAIGATKGVKGAAAAGKAAKAATKALPAAEHVPGGLRAAIAASDAAGNAALPAIRPGGVTGGAIARAELPAIEDLSRAIPGTVGKTAVAQKFPIATTAGNTVDVAPDAVKMLPSATDNSVRGALAKRGSTDLTETGISRAASPFPIPPASVKNAPAKAAGLRAAGYLAGAVDSTPGDETTPGDPAEDAANGIKPPFASPDQRAITAATKNYPLDLGESMGNATPAPQSGYELRGANQNVLPRVGAPGAGLGPEDLRSVIAKGAELHPQTGIVHGGSLREQPWYQDYLNMARQGATMSQDQRMAADLPTQIAAVNRKFTDPKNMEAPASLTPRQALLAARENANQRVAARESKRLGNVADINVQRNAQAAANAQAQKDQLAATNPEAYKAQVDADIAKGTLANNTALTNAKIEEHRAEMEKMAAEAKAAAANTPEAQTERILKEPIIAEKSGVSPEAIAAEKLKREAETGILGSHQHGKLGELYGQDWTPGPLNLNIGGSKQAFLDHVAMSGSGIKPEVAAEWWDKNVENSGWRGLNKGLSSSINSVLDPFVGGVRGAISSITGK